MQTKHREWTLVVEGRTFNVHADREYRNRRPGHGEGETFHTVFVWERFPDGSGKSIVAPFSAYRAPLASARAVIRKHLDADAARTLEAIDAIRIEQTDPSTDPDC